MKKLLFAILLCITVGLYAEEVMPDTLLYKWDNYNQRSAFRQDLENRLSIITEYKGQEQSVKKNLIYSAVWPGWGQLRAKQQMKGQIFVVGSAAAAYLMIQQLQLKNQYYSDYEDQTQIEQMNDCYDKAKKHLKMACLYGGLYAIIWGINLNDSINATNHYNQSRWDEILKKHVAVTPTGVSIKY